MKKIALFLVAAALFSGCSKEPQVTLFGVTLGDSVKNAPPSIGPCGDNGNAFDHEPPFPGKWTFSYYFQDDKITEVFGWCICETSAMAESGFAKAKEWFCFKYPQHEEKDEDGFKCLIVNTNSFHVSCSLNTKLNTIYISGNMKNKTKRPPAISLER